MRKFLLLILIFCTNITAQKSWTLKECVERALEKNISIKQTELNFAEAELNKKKCNWKFYTQF
jgi:outer membrane protein